VKKRIAVVACLGLMTTALLAVGMPTGQSQTINLNPVTLSVKEGPPGTNILTHVDPAQAQAVCLNTTQATTQTQEIATSLLSQPGLGIGTVNVLQAVNNGTLHDVAAVYAVAFADIETQEAFATNAPMGWDPNTGNGSITAPDAPRPKLYAVAVVCLGLKVPTVGEANAALAGVDPTQPDAAAAALLTASINQDPIGTGFEIFCLSDGGGCPAGQEGGEVTATPRVTG
jgi:hypothetical protein